jgi:excinuclease UvrABC nuclease subunit
MSKFKIYNKTKQDDKRNEWKQHLKQQQNQKNKSNTLNFTVEELFFKPCIYFLKVNNDVVYIGQTESLMNRISQHINENVKIFTHFDCLFFEGSFKQRLFEEKRLIRKYKPLYNVIHNK